MGKKRRILIAVDVQPEFGFTKAASPLRYLKIVTFIRENRDQYDQIIATQCVNDTDTNMFKSGAWPKQLVSPRPLDFLADKVIVKSSYGLPLRELREVAAISKDNVAYDVIGYNTDCCVLAVALQLFDLQMDVNVLTEYCYSSSGNEHHQRGVNLLRDLLGKNCVLPLGGYDDSDY